MAGLARGRELTRKDQRLSSGLVPLDCLLEGGLACGRITEIVARGFGWMNIAAAFVATVTRRGEAAAWIDTADAFDPASMAAAGRERLAGGRMLCSGGHPQFVRGEQIRTRVISCAGLWRRTGGRWIEYAFAPDYYELALADGGVYRAFR